mmetsp:Transcript_77176/g.152999  ORF Transcript_77176/g.152999 Transcript_77176/m.152999 type:complete len:216 (+) Transcript_77176:188-835(+)
MMHCRVVLHCRNMRGLDAWLPARIQRCQHSWIRCSWTRWWVLGQQLVMVSLLAWKPWTVCPHMKVWSALRNLGVAKHQLRNIMMRNPRRTLAAALKGRRRYLVYLVQPRICLIMPQRGQLTQVPSEQSSRHTTLALSSSSASVWTSFRRTSNCEEAWRQTNFSKNAYQSSTCVSVAKCAASAGSSPLPLHRPNDLIQTCGLQSKSARLPRPSFAW